MSRHCTRGNLDALYLRDIVWQCSQSTARGANFDALRPHCGDFVQGDNCTFTIPKELKMRCDSHVRTPCRTAWLFGGRALPPTSRMMDRIRSSSFHEGTLWRTGPSAIGSFAFSLDASWWSGEAILKKIGCQQVLYQRTGTSGGWGCCIGADFDRGDCYGRASWA